MAKKSFVHLFFLYRAQRWLLKQKHTVPKSVSAKKGFPHINFILTNNKHLLKKILLKDLNYWNVELQEAYFSPQEVKKRFDKIK